MSNTQAYNGGVTYNQPIARRTAGKAAAVGLSGLMALAPATVGAEEKTPIPSTNIGQHVLQLEEGQTRPLKDINAQLKRYGLEIADMAKAERELSRYGLGKMYGAQQTGDGNGPPQESKPPEEERSAWKTPLPYVILVVSAVGGGYAIKKLSNRKKPVIEGGT